jgi:hypothetical protein
MCSLPHERCGNHRRETLTSRDILGIINRERDPVPA